jgi:hypothetical protein
MDPTAPLWHTGRNLSRDRPRARAHGDTEGGIPLSLRPHHSFAPYPLSRFPPGSQHSLSHGTSFSHGSTRLSIAPQLGQGGWPLMPPSQGTSLGPTDDIHHPTSINTGFTMNVSSEWCPDILSIAAETGEDWRRLIWNATDKIGRLTPLLLLPNARYVITSRGSVLLRFLLIFRP